MEGLIRPQYENLWFYLCLFKGLFGLVYFLVYVKQLMQINKLLCIIDYEA